MHPTLRTVEHVRAHRHAGTAKPSEPMPPSRPPVLVESDYAAEIKRVLDIRGALAPVMRALPGLIGIAEDERRVDELDFDGNRWRWDEADVAPRDRIVQLAAELAAVDLAVFRADASKAAVEAQRVFDEARKKIAAATSQNRLNQIALVAAGATSKAQRSLLREQAVAAVGVDVVTHDRSVPPLVAQFAHQNVVLIRSLGNASLDHVEKLVAHAFTTGRRAEDVARDIAARYGISDRHASLIARDQIGSLNSRITAARHQELGITRFSWQTMGDQNVRPEHEDLQDQEFDYPDGAPGEGLPGEPIACRCTQQPVFDDILSLLENAGADDSADDEEEPEEPAPVADVDTAGIPVDASSVPDTDAGITLVIPDASAFLQRGYFEPPGGHGDTVRNSNAGRAIREGQRDAIKMTINEAGELSIADGRHRMAAAIEAKSPIKVRFVRGAANTAGEVNRQTPGATPPPPASSPARGLTDAEKRAPLPPQARATSPAAESARSRARAQRMMPTMEEIAKAVQEHRTELAAPATPMPRGQPIPPAPRLTAEGLPIRTVSEHGALIPSPLGVERASSPARAITHPYRTVISDAGKLPPPSVDSGASSHVGAEESAHKTERAAKAFASRVNNNPRDFAGMKLDVVKVVPDPHSVPIRGESPPKNAKRVEAARKAGEASAARVREIHGAVTSNLSSDLHVAWESEGHKFLKEEAKRIHGIKDPISAASKISEAFAEKYARAGESSVFANEGDRYAARVELESKHAEKWVDEEEAKHFEKMRLEAFDAGDIDEHGELTAQGHENQRRLEEEDAPHVHKPNASDDEVPF